MSRFKTLVILATAAAALAVGACRHEVPYGPMKLGADIQATGQVR